MGSWYAAEQPSLSASHKWLTTMHCWAAEANTVDSIKSEKEPVRAGSSACLNMY